MAKAISFLFATCLLGVLCSVLITGNGHAVAADDRAEAKLENEKKAPQRKLDRESERGVLQMVQDHLPEIKVLLDHLREKEPQQYNAAIVNLAKSARRLQAAKKRGETSFELEVHVVQAQSAINLLVAKLKIRDNKDDRTALRRATKQLELAEFARANDDVNQMRSRLDKMREQLEAAETRLSEKRSKMDDNIEKGFQIYLRKSGRKE